MTPSPLAQASLFISACVGRASREPIQSVVRAALMIWLHFSRVYGFIIRRCAERMGSAPQTRGWEMFAPVHVAGVSPKLGMKETIALVDGLV